MRNGRSLRAKLGGSCSFPGSAVRVLSRKIPEKCPVCNDKLDLYTLYMYNKDVNRIGARGSVLPRNI